MEEWRQTVKYLTYCRHLKWISNCNNNHSDGIRYTTSTDISQMYIWMCPTRKGRTVQFQLLLLLPIVCCLPGCFWCSGLSCGHWEQKFGSVWIIDCAANDGIIITRVHSWGWLSCTGRDIWSGGPLSIIKSCDVIRADIIPQSMALQGISNMYVYQ